MFESLRVLLANSVDYAGQFPPARLPMDEALQNFQRFKSSPDRWMLSRYVCPVGQLGDLAGYPATTATPARIRRGATAPLNDYETFMSFLATQLGVERASLSSSTSFAENLGADSLDTVELVMELEEEFDVDVPPNVVEEIDTLGDLWRLLSTNDATKHALAIIGSPADSLSQLPLTLRQDVRRMVDFASRADAAFQFDAYELRLPQEIEQKALQDFVSDFQRQIYVAELSLNRVFLELTVGDDWCEQVAVVASVLQSDLDTPLQWGLKIRTGGEDQLSHPSPAELAHFIDVCALAQVPWKATAGLHEPLWHFNPAVESWQFGFLNVFTAAILSATNSISKDEIAEILTANSAELFLFDDVQMSFNGQSATLSAIERARRESAISFGSCSFLEPLDGLRTLGLA